MNKKTITPERTAHLYALMAWNDSYTREQAEDIAYTKGYEELNSITWAETSIQAAIKGIKENLLKDKILPEKIDWSKIKIESNEEVFDSIIKILEVIHDKWVVENAKKYNRGTEEKSNKNLFQHLPTALIGIDELAKDLMFLAPILKEMGVNTGEMDLSSYGTFKPNEEVINAYNRYIQKYKEENKISSIEELDLHIKDCVYGAYKALKPISDVGKERLKFMRDRIELLSNTVMKKNQAEFGKLPEHTVIV